MLRIRLVVTHVHHVSLIHGGQVVRLRVIPKLHPELHEFVDVVLWQLLVADGTCFGMAVPFRQGCVDSIWVGCFSSVLRINGRLRWEYELQHHTTDGHLMPWCMCVLCTSIRRR